MIEEKKIQDVEHAKGVVVDSSKKARFWIGLNITLAVFSVVLAGVIYVVITRANGQEVKIPLMAENDTMKKNTVPDGKVRRKIDGVYVDAGRDNLPAISVMIDNHVDARPSYGISKANVVIEAEVEGNITRLMPIFASGEEVKQIGSVRSARPYFVDWAHEYSSLYAHCGGSPEALVKIEQDEVMDLNEFYNAQLYWRGKEKSAPHNVYTSSEKLYAYLADKGIKDGGFFPWKFKDDLDIEQRPTNQSIKISYALADFVVEWKYDKDNNNYIRKMGGDFHKDGEGNIITAKNVVIQYATAHELDDKLRLKMDVIGEGDAEACFDGSCIKGKWKKKNAAARTRFYDGSDNEIEFNAGITWIELVRPERKVVISAN